ncbi:MAG: AtpZ/AtpI family protein [Saprospiraceae bacterium]
MKYSGMAFEMAAILFVFVFGGKKLDDVVKTETPWFTILGVFLGAFAALYFTLKDIFINKK